MNKMEKTLDDSSRELSEQSPQLRMFKIFNGFKGEDLKTVRQVFNLQEFKKGEPIHLPDQTEGRLYFAIEGRIKLSRIDHETGRELILDIINPGEIFGLMAFVGKPYSDTIVVAFEQCVVGYITEEKFNSIIEEKPAACFSLTKMAEQRLSKIENRLEELLFRDIPCRLARLLLRLRKEYRIEFPCGTKIDLRLTQQDIANLIGATREMASLSLNDFKRSGWIEIHQHHICIHDTQALQRIAA